MLGKKTAMRRLGLALEEIQSLCLYTAIIPKILKDELSLYM